MKPSPKKSLSSKVKQRTKSSSSNSAGTSNSAQSGATNHHNHTGGGGNAGASGGLSQHHQLRIAATAGGSESCSSGNDGAAGSGKEKGGGGSGAYKSYAGFSSRSVRTIWEQHDKQETEVAADVYNKLAEDTTYKLWELANNIKTYSRHASGKVTYDLVNEVLKDCDVPPIVGANNEPWDKIEYDGVYFFNSDEVLDLREEYIKDVTMEQSNIPVLTTSWMAESAIAEDLIELYNQVCDAVYIGDEECFEEAIDILTNNPHVPSLMKLLLTKAIEMLGFEYTETTLVRTLQFLEALVKNYHVSHSDLTLELSLLCQIFVNLLLGSPSLAKFIAEQQLDVQPPSQRSQHPLSMAPNGTESSLGSGPPSQQNNNVLDQPSFHSAMVPMNILESNHLGPSEDSNNSNSNATEELLRSIENIKEGPDGIDINNIKDEYEALFSMVQGLNKQEGGEVASADAAADSFIKTEFTGEFDGGGQNFIVQQAGGHSMLNESELNFEIKQENVFKLKQEPDVEEAVSLSVMSDGATNDDEQQEEEEVNNPNSTTLESENITTLICGDALVDDVARVVGLCAGKWGFVEQECTFLLVERLQRYFEGDRKPTAIDYGWLSRVLRGLWSVGEFAFRELSPYFEKIAPELVPEFVNPYFNVAGIFLRGKSDIFFYEYLNEICGDGLTPFIFQYEHYIESRYRRHDALRRKANEAKHRYKITPKVVLTVHLKPPPSLKPPPTVHDLFPERTTDRTLASVQHPAHPVARFSFRFAGCRPLPLKVLGKSRPTGRAFGGAPQDAHASPVKCRQNETLARNFRAKVVVARRKMLAPDTNLCGRQRVYCYGSTVL
uniref:Uncharacterized protein n=1 Tax=Culex tarsalis TaxID=7177 RepID=A0A1Q3FAV6_CULTA